MATRCNEVSTRQPSPMSCGPMTKNGSTIKSRASVQILVGAGKVAPGWLHSISQSRSSSPSVTSGGTTLAAALERSGRMRAETLDEAVLSLTTSAGAPRAGAAVVASAFSMGMFIGESPGRGALRFIDSDDGTLDGQ